MTSISRHLMSHGPALSGDAYRGRGGERRQVDDNEMDKQTSAAAAACGC